MSERRRPQRPIPPSRVGMFVGITAGLLVLVLFPLLPSRLDMHEGQIAEIEPYAQLSDHYFDDTVKEQRLGRRTDEASAEIDAISAKAKALRKRILRYLNDLSRSITEIGGTGEDSG